jgi:hypothetical protein
MPGIPRKKSKSLQEAVLLMRLQDCKRFQIYMVRRRLATALNRRNQAVTKNVRVNDFGIACKMREIRTIAASVCTFCRSQ